ncbi:alpha hydrolase [Pyrococcus furiosus DSM 3638]|uniref:N-type ATP pyrophosphatase superfamily n=3 Tax=Pyrococcus furiosus TaxID=2261 RepID=Q8U423_PYRFU|nr:MULTISPECIES: TIGR00269 family protein [Pyrococcus]AAL80397.1 n-type ATP pyrophosphatase superfamily [Pyrococcus furiosus DSM 3638]MDK2870219.1 tRNA-5-methyluridine54 2-sulfurtransferase [Pyrococcus sp.]QEK79679.1 alpha hydrolase [Pyrococcus furiosus DSM 3638]
MYLCEEHFKEYFERKVARTIEKYKLASKDERILVAVSGGKDSAVTAYVLKKLGYKIECLHLNLGIGEYSEKSEIYAKKQCEFIGAPLNIIRVKELLGYGIGEVRTSRPTCSYCGLTKRYIMNKFAYDNGFDAVATGHNLDDEASFLMNNLLHWNTEYLAKGGPLLPGEGKFVKKIKPLYELTEREVVAYAIAVGLEYIVEECPYARGATTLDMKEVLNELEEKRPGTKFNFVRGFLRKKKLFEPEVKGKDLKECKICGMPASGEICSFCKFWKLGKPLTFKIK